MDRLIEQKPTAFIDRRNPFADDDRNGPERRQFRDAHDSCRPEVNELAEAVDQYKLRHRRRFITFEELYDVITSLGYQK